VRPLPSAADVLHMDRENCPATLQHTTGASPQQVPLSSIAKEDGFVPSSARINLDEQKKQESVGACSWENQSFIRAYSGTGAGSFGAMAPRCSFEAYSSLPRLSKKIRSRAASIATLASANPPRHATQMRASTALTAPNGLPCVVGAREETKLPPVQGFSGQPQTSTDAPRSQTLGTTPFLVPATTTSIPRVHSHFERLQHR
jgi:hypothetical protein